MKEYKNFLIYDSDELQHKMENEWKGWKIVAITNEFGTALGAVLRWKVWVEKTK